MASLAQVAALRPAMVRSRPVRVDAVFDDPTAVLRLLRERGPYQTTAAVHNLGATMGAGAASAPWFKAYLDDPLFIENSRWIAAAREAFGAAIVRPFAAMVNLNAATPGGVPHLDLAQFRGFGAQQAPVWLLQNMAHAGLFNDWMTPIASGLAWFYRGRDGGFEYFPDGPQAPSVTERAPLWNVGVMSDNEFMWHRVEPIGTPEEQGRVRALMHFDNRLHAIEGGWEMRRGDDCLIRFGLDQVRISILWKAHVFTDAAHLASFEDERLNLTLEQVVDGYQADLIARGIAAKRPSDPLADDEWREVLQRVYAPPIEHLRAD
ncbi:hypothetical protein [Novosphingobium sp. JCM 18896]|uniref:hypothetical protein n=1 Tax=Novosphingobium sp. JCM 18896 TaxID=2989731 RepID=UPI002222129D|nr:hypothetical protein [Novosphingobium sp. JCM 18896]MCW1428166.1 hypothetical protein [Novosphingobium sp. JCM 18896]